MSTTPHNRWESAFRDLYAGQPPSAELARRVESMAAAADAGGQRKTPVRRGPLAFAVFALAAAVVALIGLCAVGPRMALARTLRTVRLNLLAVRGYHCRTSLLFRGKTTLSEELWFQDGKWRMDGWVPAPNGALVGPGQHFTIITANGVTTNLGAVPGISTVQRGQATPPNPTDQTLRQLQIVLDNGPGEDLGHTIVNGRDLQEIAFPGPVTSLFHPARKERALVWIDRKLMLPVRNEIQAQEGGGWLTLAHGDYDFSHPVAANVFEVPAARKKVAVDIDALGVSAGRRFSRALAQSRCGRATIAVRDVQVNPDGDVFVLYTDGSTRYHEIKDVSVAKITDDIGTHYTGTAGAIEPYVQCQDPRESRGLSVGSQIVQGTCMIPIRHGPARRLPRTVRLSFEDSNDGAETRYAVLSMPVRRVAALLPDYAPALKLLSCSPRDESSYRLDRAMARDAYFYNSQSDWKGLLEAAQFAERDGAAGYNITMDEIHALTALRRWREARAKLRKVREQDVFGISEGEIASAERDLEAAEKRGGM